MLNSQLATLGLLALLLMFDTRETDPFSLECSPAQADSAALDCSYLFTTPLIELLVAIRANQGILYSVSVARVR